MEYQLIRNFIKVACLSVSICTLITFCASAYALAVETVPTQVKIQNNINQALNTITPDQHSVINTKWEEEAKSETNTLTINLYRPTYVLPVYYTSNPYYAVYQGNTPDQQKLDHAEFKAQLSFFVPVINNLFYSPNQSLNVAYTQLNYWQVYAHSQYFRETNYEPELFYDYHFHPNWLFRMSIDHQSNGRGGDLERSWNRVIGALQLSGDNWLIGLNVWQLIFQAQSSDLHNPDIAYYLGHENLLLSYKIKKLVASLQLQNLESGLSRGSVTATLSYPLTTHFSIYLQGFAGYGQSLIEYNHRTQGIGLGVAFNDWI